MEVVRTVKTLSSLPQHIKNHLIENFRLDGDLSFFDTEREVKLSFVNSRFNGVPTIANNLFHIYDITYNLDGSKQQQSIYHFEKPDYYYLEDKIINIDFKISYEYDEDGNIKYDDNIINDDIFKEMVLFLKENFSWYLPSHFLRCRTNEEVIEQFNKNKKVYWSPFSVQYFFIYMMNFFNNLFNPQFNNSPTILKKFRYGRYVYDNKFNYLGGYENHIGDCVEITMTKDFQFNLAIHSLCEYSFTLNQELHYLLKDYKIHHLILFKDISAYSYFYENFLADENLKEDDIVSYLVNKTKVEKNNIFSTYLSAGLISNYLLENYFKKLFSSMYRFRVFNSNSNNLYFFADSKNPYISYENKFYKVQFFKLYEYLFFYDDLAKKKFYQALSFANGNSNDDKNTIKCCFLKCKKKD